MPRVISFMCFAGNKGGAGAPATIPLAVLDAFAAGLWSCCWMRRLLTAYAGPLMRVRRSSDNAELDIGYLADNTLDAASLVAFSGAASAFVTTLYDQSGAALNAVQATAGKQPRIVNAGVFDGTLVFDGVDDALATANSGTPSVVSMASRAAMRNTAGTYVLLEHGTASPTAGQNNAVIYNETAIQRTNMLISEGAANYRLNETNAVAIAGVVGAIFDYSLVASAKCAFYKGGALQVVSMSGVAGVEPVGPFTAGPWNFGARNNGAALPAPLDASGFVIWQGVNQAANMAAIDAILAEGTA